LDLKEEATPVSQFFEHIFSVFEPQLQNQQLDYELNIQLEDENLHLFLDRNKLEKIVNNFLSNAIKFTSKPGKVTLTIIEETAILKILVSDTGKGVHPNDLPHIFERFYQSKQPDVMAYGGTGIGLALVSEFANLMNGKAYAESSLGEGSHFFFELPKKIASPQVLLNISDQLEEDQNTELIDAIGTDFNILVVEDNHDMRNFVVSLLKKRYKVLSAKNGLEGLEQLSNPNNHIHLVISDVMMPEMDGLTMLKHIKSSDKGRGIPVIMLTALAAEQDKLQALTVGVDDYLTKPFSVQELLIRVQNLLYNYVQRKNWFKTEGLELISSPQQKTAQPKTQQKELEEAIPSISIEEQEWLKEVETYAKTGIGNRQFNATQLYLFMNMTEQTFRRHLRKLTGMTANKYIRELRLQEARKLLEQKKYSSIQQICSSIGFSTPKYFSKQFKERFGKNPSEYLK
ncbi:MAG: response regulator, partial [Aureispira sp.]|nr:response regulator [Aureispira sp.]